MILQLHHLSIRIDFDPWNPRTKHEAQSILVEEQDHNVVGILVDGGFRKGNGGCLAGQ